MKLVELELYSEATNNAVVRAPGRSFPGVVVQGDSLHSLCTDAKLLSARLQDLGVKDEELLYLAYGLQENLLSRLLHYQQVLAQHAMELPYSNPATPSDLVPLVPADGEP